MSRRHDPFSPDGNWENTMATPVDLTPGESLTGDAALRTDTPEPEAPQKAAKPRRARRPSKSAQAELEEALERLDKATT